MVVGTAGSIFLFGADENDGVIVVGRLTIDQSLSPGGFFSTDVVVNFLITDGLWAVNFIAKGE